MDKVIQMFPELAKEIFNQLDDEDLVDCLVVSRSWSFFVKNETLTFSTVNIFGLVEENHMQGRAHLTI